MNDTIQSHIIIVYLRRSPGGWRHLSHARGNLTGAQRCAFFLDELPEFNRSVLEVMRQPLEDDYMDYQWFEFDEYTHCYCPTL